MSLRNDSMTWSVATPTCVAPSPSIPRTDPTTPLTAATSSPAELRCGGAPKKWRNNSYVPSTRCTFISGLPCCQSYKTRLAAKIRSAGPTSPSAVILAKNVNLMLVQRGRCQIRHKVATIDTDRTQDLLYQSILRVN